MTREEAIDLLDNLIGFVEDNHDSDYDKALKMAIEALKQEPSEDTIPRSTAITLVNDLQTNGGFSCYADYEYLYDHLSTMPSINPQEPKYCYRNICIKNEYNSIGCDECEVTKSQEPKTGHWIKIYLTDTGDIDGQCSECGFIHTFIDRHTAQYNHCPNCGAKMESEVRE